jgi:hypothetical protein
MFCLTSGSDTRGQKPFDAEMDFYEEILSAITEVFGGRQFPSQLISSAFDVTQLRRLKERTPFRGSWPGPSSASDAQT